MRPVKATTIRDVARAADVSVATVSRALNAAQIVSPATRERVLAIAAELDYVPHSGARALSRRRTDTLGVLLPDLHGEFFSELIRGIDAATRTHGLHLLLSHTHGDPAEAVTVLRAMRSRVDAMLVMSPGADGAALAGAMNGEAALVLLGSSACSDRHPTLSVDNFAGARAMADHLLDSGHRRIAFLAGPADNIEAVQRLEGFLSGLAARGVAPQAVLCGDFSQAAGMHAVRELHQTGLPDALFAANDVMAIGALQALREFGLAVPRDLALAGFDDIPVARFLDPPLSTVAVPIAEIGRQAVECALELRAGKAVASKTFQPSLVIRGSTRPHHHIRPESREQREDQSHGQLSID